MKYTFYTSLEIIGRAGIRRANLSANEIPEFIDVFFFPSSDATFLLTFSIPRPTTTTKKTKRRKLVATYSDHKLSSYLLRFLCQQQKELRTLIIFYILILQHYTSYTIKMNAFARTSLKTVPR